MGSCFAVPEKSPSKAGATREAQEDTDYREMAQQLIPHLEIIDSTASDLDCEIETLTLKKQKVVQLMKRKNLILKFVNGQKSLTSDLKQLFDSEWIESYGLLGTIRSFTFTATIAIVPDVEKREVESEKFHSKGFTLFVFARKSLTDEEEWLDIGLQWRSKSFPGDWESEIKFQIVLLNCDLAKNPKSEQNHRGIRTAGIGTYKFLSWKLVKDPSNGFISDEGSIKVDVFIEKLCIRAVSS